MSSLASVRFSGDSTRDLREFHPRRVLQHLHDIYRREKILGDYVAIKLLAEVGHDDIDRSTDRERQERWRSNGEFSARVLIGAKIKIRGENFWVRWAQEMSKYMEKSNFKHEVLEQIALHMMNDGVIASLTFEAELVSKYFDITYSYHAFGGETCDRAGFRLLELPYLLIDFIIPFWNKAKAKPESAFPDTVAAINGMRDPAKAKKKMEQLKISIDAVVDRMGTLHEKWFQPPLVFTFVTHPVHGPPLLRVLLNCVKDAINAIPEDDRDFNYDGDNAYETELEKNAIVTSSKQWGKHDYIGINGMPLNMQTWYEMLHPVRNDVLHWWQQLGFGTNILRDELIDLSREDIDDHIEGSDLPRDADSSIRIHDFYTHYPKIYDFFKAAFGLGPSNSRISEMAHSFVRNFFDEQIPFLRLDDMLRFIMDQEYTWRQARREVTRESRQSKTGFGIRNRGAVKDHDTKATCAMAGSQLAGSLGPYCPKAVAKLPQDMQEKIKISKIKVEGTTQMEKDRNEKLLEKCEANKERRAKKKSKKKNSQPGLDLDKLRKESEEAETEHEKKWSSREHLARMELVKKFLLKSHYNSISGKTGGHFNFQLELKLVLPGFYKRKGVKDAAKNAITKPDGNDNLNLGKYLIAVKDIAFNGKKNTLDKLTKKELDKMSQLEILEHFVKVDASPSFLKVQGEIKEKQRRVQGIMKSFGTDVFRLQRYKNIADRGSVSNGEDGDDRLSLPNFLPGEEDG